MSFQTMAITYTVSLADIKAWLKLPAADDSELDPILTSLLTAASEQIGTACDLTLVADDSTSPPQILSNAVAELIKIAIKFRVASWYDNPSPSASAEESAQRVIDALISKNRVYTYPD